MDTREGLATELAQERFDNAEEQASQGGIHTEFRATTTLKDFMAEALEFVDRCRAL